ncbi:JAB1/Mov34/MPN/PAD-1 ubiquitin protease-domain-containing protein [Crucibulum laeve]|uniref:Eukaryotic translation initiation factor 3 subunit F n=1 Tax=Crucibulum laeve TaxID=68775 RepID=A0A5C3MFS5_9AGAR|nr:JAB1/Mov34/MPN/PAD-1 ubiquitin protease-domain-containing protein [Crucibulum laeve]
MSLGPSSSAIHIQSSSSGDGSHNSSRAPTKITIHPVALFSILDHYLRRTDSQDRVIGTLLGTRTDTEIEVKSSFAVLHSETSEQVAVDMEYHRTMYELHHKVNPKEVIVGWYSTGSNLNTYSALIQNFYSQETAPHQAIHVAVNTGAEEGQEADVKAYARRVPSKLSHHPCSDNFSHSAPVGVFPKPENCIFVPVPVELRFHDAERSGLDLLATTATSSTSTTGQPIADLEILERSIHSVSDMLDRVLTYVRAVLTGEQKGDQAIGRYLMDTLGASTDDLEKGGFNASLQDTLMISYLANLVRSQAEVSARLALTAAS